MKKLIKNLTKKNYAKNYIKNHKVPKRIQTFEDSIWTEFAVLAGETKSTNLGQGFPDFKPPDFVIKNAIDVLQNEPNQYTRARGSIPLVQAIKKQYQKDFKNHEIDEMNEIQVTNGATGGYNTLIQSLVNPGDEVIIMEPFFDMYTTQVNLCGGKPVYVTLRPESEKSNSAKDWKLDMGELKKAITKKTKVLILNNPHNPTGKIFSLEELKEIAEIAKEYNLIVISDEVYDKLIFKGETHHRIADLPGMWERTVTICSSGKTFSITGWKIGWLIGPKDLIFNAYLVNQNAVYCVSNPIQVAVAKSMNDLETTQKDYVKNFSGFLETNCNELLDILEGVGMKTIRPQSGYFILADHGNINFPYTKGPGKTRDYEFSRWLPKELGVITIPPSPFYDEPRKHLVETLTRVCFCKKPETLKEAGKRLKRLSKFQK